MKLRRDLLPLLIGILLGACAAPAARPASQAGGGQPAAAQPVVPSRTLVVASRNEPPTLAAKPLRFFAASRGIHVPLSNGTLDYLDHKGNAQPYLVEALPQLNTESWKVNPDGTMETTYRLKPNLVWHDGSPLTAADAYSPGSSTERQSLASRAPSRQCTWRKSAGRTSARS